MGRKHGFSFSWRRATGYSAAKGRLSRKIGVPLTRSGRQRKLARSLGCLLQALLILIFSLFVLGAVSARSQTQRPQTGRVVAENASLRQTPSAEGQSEMNVPVDTIVKVLDQKGAWYVVRIGDRVGWMYSAVIVGAEVDAVPLKPFQLAPVAPEKPTVVGEDNAPPTTASPKPTSASSGGGYSRGPRGGCYYINSSGKKVYVDHSKCN